MPYWTSDKIKALRKMFGESQEVFARRLGVTVTALRFWEQDRSGPGGSAQKLMDLLEKFAREGSIRELVG